MSSVEAFLPEQLSGVAGTGPQIASGIRIRYTIDSELVVHTRTSYFLPDRHSTVDQQDDASRKRGQ